MNIRIDTAHNGQDVSIITDTNHKAGVIMEGLLEAEVCFSVSYTEDAPNDEEYVIKMFCPQ